MSRHDTALCASGEAAWHAAAYRAHRAPWHPGAAIAWSERFVHRYLLGAVTLAPEALVPDEVAGPVRDSFGSLELDGWQAHDAQPWMLRPQGIVDVRPPDGVRIVTTDDPLAFERTAFLGFEDAPETPGELHPAGPVPPGLTFLLAVLADGTAVGTALAARTPRSVHLSGVTVLPGERRRGIGAALSAAAVRCGEGVTATLATSEQARGTYERLGFAVVPGRPLQWTRATG